MSYTLLNVDCFDCFKTLRILATLLIMLLNFNEIFCSFGFLLLLFIGLLLLIL